MAKAAVTKKADSQAARTKLLEAAMKVFARDGLYRATTRVIAEEAGVNEVTLFRHFQSKEGLLSTMMNEIVRANADENIGDEQDWTVDLEKNLLRFGLGVYTNLVRDEAIIRTMIGEANRHREHARKIILEAVRPVRARFIGNLESARRAGLLRDDVDLGTVADAFTGVLMGGMLRITGGCSEGYSSDEYVRTCIKIFAAGLAAVPARIS